MRVAEGFQSWRRVDDFRLRSGQVRGQYFVVGREAELVRHLSDEEAVALIVNGFVKDVIQQLPMEFAVEAQKLISISLEGSVG